MKKKLRCKLFGCICNTGNIADFTCPRCGTHHKVSWPAHPKEKGLIMNNKGLVLGELMIALGIICLIVFVGGMGH